MRRYLFGAVAGAILGTWAAPLAAQDAVRVLDLGGPPVERGTTVPDSVLRAAVLLFNGAGTTRLDGTLDLAPGATMQGSIGLYQKRSRIAGTVRGSVIVLNGDLRIASTGRVEGDVIVLGGRLTVAPGGVIVGDSTVWLGAVTVSRAADGTVSQKRPSRIVTDFTSASTSFLLGPVQTTLHADADGYNRTEGLPLRIGPTFAWHPDSANLLRLDLNGIVRTASDPSGERPDVGWNGRLAVRHGGPRPLTLGVEGGSTIVPVIDRAYAPLESGLGAFLFRRDYRDWYASKGWGAFASVDVTPALTVSAAYHWSRERTARAADAFSLFRSNETWRANPLIDDGSYRTVSFGVTWDTRDNPARPTSGWYLRGDIRQVSSSELTPVSLPTEIRDPVPTVGYRAEEIDFDARYYLRLNPTQSVHFRAAGGGWLGGDPLLIQHRRSMGGLDPMAGYGFRFLNCDRRLRPDPALPALCDRQLLLQAEYRHAVPINFATRVGSRTIGLQRVDFVAFGDLGTAWLAGPGKGRVPSNRIQNIGEWRSDIGVGLDGGSLGIYVGKAIADREPVRLFIRLQPRF